MLVGSLSFSSPLEPVFDAGAAPLAAASGIPHRAQRVSDQHLRVDPLPAQLLPRQGVSRSLRTVLPLSESAATRRLRGRRLRARTPGFRNLEPASDRPEAGLTRGRSRG